MAAYMIYLATDMAAYMIYLATDMAALHIYMATDTNTVCDRFRGIHK
jgi:hypothetical protein